MKNLKVYFIEMLNPTFLIKVLTMLAVMVWIIIYWNTAEQLKWDKCPFQANSFGLYLVVSTPSLKVCNSNVSSGSEIIYSPQTLIPEEVTVSSSPPEQQYQYPNLEIDSMN